MSIGGTVVDVYEDSEKMYVETRDNTYGDRVQVRLEKGNAIQFGDTLWWHSQTAYWTPVNKRFKDKPIKKIANSVGLPRPC